MEIKKLTESLNLGTTIETNGLTRFAPEPQNGLATTFNKVLSGVSSVAGGVVGGITGINPEYMDLINKQIEVQVQMQLVSFHSNIEKSRHETQMAAVRNVRVG